MPISPTFDIINPSELFRKVLPRSVSVAFNIFICHAPQLQYNTKFRSGSVLLSYLLYDIEKVALCLTQVLVISKNINLKV